jgi:hypothetical protein
MIHSSSTSLISFSIPSPQSFFGGFLGHFGVGGVGGVVSSGHHFDSGSIGFQSSSTRFTSFPCLSYALGHSSVCLPFS